MVGNSSVLKLLFQWPTGKFSLNDDVLKIANRRLFSSAVSNGHVPLGKDRYRIGFERSRASIVFTWIGGKSGGGDNSGKGYFSGETRNKFHIHLINGRNDINEHIHQCRQPCVLLAATFSIKKKIFCPTKSRKKKVMSRGKWARLCQVSVTSSGCLDCRGPQLRFLAQGQECAITEAIWSDISSKIIIKKQEETKGNKTPNGNLPSCWVKRE